jgi:hypothetical protein
VSFDWADGTTESGLDLLENWCSHLMQFANEVDLGEPYPARFWGIFDYFGALFVRSRLESAIGVGVQPPPSVVVADRFFRTITVPDSELRLAALGRLLGDWPQVGWWWERIPRGGPAAAELLEMTTEEPTA